MYRKKIMNLQFNTRQRKCEGVKRKTKAHAIDKLLAPLDNKRDLNVIKIIEL